MNFDEMDLSNLSEDEIIKMYSDIIDNGDAEDKLHIIAGCPINGWAYCSPKSDRRLKEQITDNTSGLEEINKLNIKNFVYINDSNKTPHVGVIAQELMTVFPNAVRENKDGYLEIRTEDVFFAMVNAVKELSEKNRELELELEVEIERINNSVKRLELENMALRH